MCEIREHLQTRQLIYSHQQISSEWRYCGHFTNTSHFFLPRMIIIHNLYHSNGYYSHFRLRPLPRPWARVFGFVSPGDVSWIQHWIRSGRWETAKTETQDYTAEYPWMGRIAQARSYCPLSIWRRLRRRTCLWGRTCNGGKGGSVRDGSFARIQERWKCCCWVQPNATRRRRGDL